MAEVGKYIQFRLYKYQDYGKVVSCYDWGVVVSQAESRASMAVLTSAIIKELFDDDAIELKLRGKLID